MLQRDAADGIHRIEDAYTNWYLVADGNDLTVVDTGLPSSWKSLQSALRELRRSAADVRAVVLTHGHFDHMGFAERARTELGVPVYEDDAQLDVPGHPRVVFTPGHTYGHCSLHFPGRGAVIAGDAVVTLNPYTGRRGPQIVAGAATADSKTALSSLDALAATGAQTVLTGHGPAWTDGIAHACELARAAGPS
jgi:glyoxylase-like metal-dependent hydrolase (beta-lactamase superfamily II)